MREGGRVGSVLHVYDLRIFLTLFLSLVCESLSLSLDETGIPAPVVHLLDTHSHAFYGGGIHT